MTHAVLDPPALRRLVERSQPLDQTLPPWARRSHPVAKRQLGIYWKTLPLEVGLWVRLLLLQAGLVLAAIPFPLLYSLVMPIVTVSIILVPCAFYLYGQVLFNIARQSAAAIFDERRSHTLALLLVTPLPLHEILLSKIAAAIWRGLDNLSLVLTAHVFFSLPILVLHYANLFAAEQLDPLLTAGAIIAALALHMARLFVEPVLVGAVGVLIGACLSPRIAAEIVAVTLGAAYFVFVNLPRLLPLSPLARLLVETALPLLLALVLAAGALALALRLLRRSLD